MTTSLSLRKDPALQVEIKRVPMFESIVWLRRGWDDLRHIGAPSLGHGVMIALLGAVLLILGGSHPYLVAAAITGYLLVGPIMTTGLCELRSEEHTSELQSP